MNLIMAAVWNYEYDVKNIYDETRYDCKGTSIQGIISSIVFKWYYLQMLLFSLV